MMSGPPGSIPDEYKQNKLESQRALIEKSARKKRQMPLMMQPNDTPGGGSRPNSGRKQALQQQQQQQQQSLGSNNGSWDESRPLVRGDSGPKSRNSEYGNYVYTGPAAGLEMGSGEPMPGSTEDSTPVGRPYMHHGGGGSYSVHGVTEGDSRDMSDTDSDDIPTIPTGQFTPQPREDLRHVFENIELHLFCTRMATGSICSLYICYAKAQWDLTI
ncbi:tubby-like protein [Plakobranchus ocellatus]|uniref:Tubby-like protein n=1 Tax=Plakobranchus ocellatus TaxID=259542 RepID=A0AAV4AAC4_9GAST|nr:tubby-like protein [Plakobranchus ocellatus]